MQNEKQKHVPDPTKPLLPRESISGYAALPLPNHEVMSLPVLESEADNEMD